MAAKHGFAEIIEIEDDAQALAEDLKDGIDPDASVSRDLLGTLHVNLSVLATRVERALKALEARHGFVRESKP